MSNSQEIEVNLAELEPIAKEHMNINDRFKKFNSSREHEFNMENLPPFKYYRIKFLLTSTNQVYVPRVSNLRVITLA